MGVPSPKERRTSNRRPVQHLIPSCLVEAATARRMSGILVDVSPHGLRLNTTTPVEPGAHLILLTLRGTVPLTVAWRSPRGTQGVWACGLAVTDDGTDLAAMFSSFLC